VKQPWSDGGKNKQLQK